VAQQIPSVCMLILHIEQLAVEFMTDKISTSQGPD